MIGPLGTNFSEILIEIVCFFIQRNAFEIVVCEMAAILSRERWVNAYIAPSGLLLESCYQHRGKAHIEPNIKHILWTINSALHSDEAFKIPWIILWIFCDFKEINSDNRMRLTKFLLMAYYSRNSDLQAAFVIHQENINSTFIKLCILYFIDSLQSKQNWINWTVKNVNTCGINPPYSILNDGFTFRSSDHSSSLTQLAVGRWEQSVIKLLLFAIISCYFNGVPRSLSINVYIYLYMFVKVIIRLETGAMAGVRCSNHLW